MAANVVFEHANNPYTALQAAHVSVCRGFFLINLRHCASESVAFRRVQTSGSRERMRLALDAGNREISIGTQMVSSIVN